jgi:predicted acetyltransferase
MVLESFVFLEPGELRDHELELVLIELRPGDPAKAWSASYTFAMQVDGAKAGEIRLRPETTRDIELYGGHFGYGVEPGYRGHHYAERAVRLLLPFARQHGLDTVWITCNPDNLPSRRTCERLGATLVEIVDLPPDNDQYLDGDRAKCRYRITL